MGLKMYVQNMKDESVPSMLKCGLYCRRFFCELKMKLQGKQKRKKKKKKAPDMLKADISRTLFIQVMLTKINS